MNEPIDLGRVYLQISSNREKESSVWKVIEIFFASTDSLYGSPGERIYVLLENLVNNNNKVLPRDILDEPKWYKRCGKTFVKGELYNVTT